MTSGAAPGYAVACFDLAEARLREQAHLAGRAGLIVLCLLAPPAQDHAEAVPAGDGPRRAVLRCAGCCLPLLSHAIDVAVAMATACADPAFLAELRRVLVPRGRLVVLDAPRPDASRRSLTGMLAEAGFHVDSMADPARITAIAPRGLLP